MKRFLTFICLLYSFAAFAQPANDDCVGIVDLGVAPSCDSTTLYNNVGATATDIGFDNVPFNCDPDNVDFDNVLRDVWFSFVATDTIFDYKVEVIGCPDLVNGHPSIMNPQIAVYRGDCEFDGLQLLDCARAEAGETNADLCLTGLTPGITYFIRVDDWSASATPNSGSFKLCVDQKDPIVIIGEEDFTNQCTGEFYDSGGPDGDYDNNEDFTFTICPSDFHACINLTLEFYNIDNAGDQITFFDGDDTSAPIIGGTNGGQFSNASEGGVCYQVAASSGCLTMQFISDGTTTFEGFHGFWECSQTECEIPAPIEINELADNQQIVDNITTPQTIVTIDTVICADGAIGTFNGVGTGLGLDQGLILSTGQVAEAVGPSTFFASTGNGGLALGDEDLDILSTTGSLSQDACVVELDVFAATDQLTFEYVFGSEEYPNFVNSTTFVDIFAFLVSGPGIDGNSAINDQLNIATLPDGTTIDITSVNEDDNWEYYRDNSVVGNSLAGQSISYGGLTSDFLGIKKSLTAQVNVEPCNTYHLKLAIGDRGDSAFDSGVFISELKGGTPEIGIQYFNGIDYLVEDCTSIPDQIVIDLNTEQEDTTTFTVVISGTAELGVDYLLDIPTPVVLLPGQTQISFPITPLTDSFDEDDETIVLELTNDFGCGAVTFSTTTIILRDELKVEIFSGADTVYVCENTCIEMQVEGAQDFFWTPPGLFIPPDVADPEFCPTSSQFIEVLGVLGVCSDMDTVWAEVVAPELEIESLDVTNICIGDSVTMMAINNTGNSNLMWTPAIGLSDPNAQTVEAMPDVNTEYIATVELAGCTAADTITLNVDLFDFPSLTTLDTTICQNFSVTLAADIPGTTTQFQWQPSPLDMSISCLDCPNPVVTPQVNTQYTLTATSENAYCEAVATVDIEVIPADVEIQNPDTLEICLGEEVDLNSIVSNDGSGFSWTPDNAVENDTMLQTVTTPTETTQYFAFLTIGGCTVVDSILIVVDSLPDLSIRAIPEKESYCEGEEVLLVSDTYEPANFPFMEHLWDPLTGAQTPDSNLNLVILTIDTTVYVRTTTNRGCISIDTIQIDVVPTAGMVLLPSDTTVCPGEPVDMTLILDNPTITDISYEPADAVNCEGCLDPTATVFGTTTIEVSAEFDGCPIGAQATINVDNPPSLTFPNDTDLCLGENIILNGNPDPSNTYTWTASDGSDVPDVPAPDVSPTGTTTYTVTVDNGVCDLTLDLLVNVFENPVYELPNGAVICSNEPITLNAVVDPGATYQWAGQDISGSNNSVPTPTVTPGESGIFTYTLTISNPGCILMDAVDIQVNEAPAFMMPADLLICEGDVIDLNEATETPGVAYVWTTSDGMVVADPDNVSPNMTTTYNLSATNGPCPIDESFTVEVIQEVELMPFTNSPICFDDGNGEIELSVEDIGSPGEYIWSINGDEVDTGLMVSFPVSATGTFIYSLDFVNQDQICPFPETATVEVIVNESSIISGGVIYAEDGTTELGSFDINGNVTLNEDALVYEGQTIKVASFSADGVFSWSGEGEITPVENNLDTIVCVLVPLIENDDNSLLSLIIDLENENMCESTLTINIPIEENIIDIPNAFTPNDDDTNDIFRLITKARINVVSFSIFNRWGKEVYSMQDITSDDGWDGTFKDEPAPAEVYLYSITYQIGTMRVTKKGDVTLIR